MQLFGDVTSRLYYERCSIICIILLFVDSIRQSYGFKISRLDEGIIIVEYLIIYVIYRLQASCRVNWILTIPGNLQ